jgi:putative tricarboxylic transport membrane protein
MMNTVASVIQTDSFERVRARNGWSKLHLEGQAFYKFLEDQEREIGELMRELGFLQY